MLALSVDNDHAHIAIKYLLMLSIHDIWCLENDKSQNVNFLCALTLKPHTHWDDLTLVDPLFYGSALGMVN